MPDPARHPFLLSVTIAFGCSSILSTLLPGAIPFEGDGSPPKKAASDLTTKLVPEITRAEIEAHVRFLASDALGGRSTGTPEADRAARYLADVLAAYGVRPGGDDGTFLQRVPLRRTRATRAPEMEVVEASGAKRALVDGETFDAPRTAVDVHDLGVVVVARQEDVPKAADPKVALFVDASRRVREEWFMAAGNPGGRGFGLILAPGSTANGKASEFRARPGGLRRANASEDAAGAVPAVAALKGEALEAARGKKLARVSLATHVETEALASSNVVGIVRGKGRAGVQDLEHETVVLSAHYDHLAHREAGEKKGEDTIFNGADDDASGTSIVLELAGALAHGEAPARTVVILLATGEEVGLLGTEEYLDRPPVPLEKTILNLNFEMLGRPDEKVGGAGGLWLTGYAYSTLGPELAKAGLRVLDDPRPSEHFFERSDNIAFVRRGIVGQTLSTYNLHTDYHKVTDEADTLDYAHMEECARTSLAAVRLVAGGAARPTWTDAFKEVRKPR